MNATGLARVPGVEIFSTGEHQGKTYTHADLDEMVDNFRRFSWGKDARVRPPLVVGHEEEQELLKNSGIPRMGQPDSLWHEEINCRLCKGSGRINGIPCQTCLGSGRQGILKTNLANVPMSIAKLIEARAYDGVSSEVYSSPPEGVPGTGKMLRRVALLGGELPHIKNLAALPWPDYDAHAEQESLHRRPMMVIKLSEVKDVNGGWECFSELRPMDRGEIVAELARECGYKPEILDRMPDEHLHELKRAYEEGEAVTPEEKRAKAFKEEEEMEKELGKMPKEEAAKKYAEHCRKKYAEYKEKGKKMFGEDWKDEDEEELKKAKARDGKGDGKGMNFSEEDKKVFIYTITKNVIDAVTTNVTKGVEDKLLTKLTPLADKVDKFQEDTKKAGVKAFCDRCLSEGKITSAELDDTGGRPTVFTRLMGLDATQKVYKFKEGDKEIEQTALEAEMAAINARKPAVNFSEKIGGDGKTKSNDDAAKDTPENREKWATELVAKFSEAFDKMGVDTVGFVKEAKEANNPKAFAQIKADWDNFVKQAS
jgi:hypothetical protein